MKRALLCAALALATAACAVPAAAAVYPVFVPYPVIAQAGPPLIGAGQLRGTVTAFDRFNMTVRADGQYLPVQLHQGTIINPTGLTLAPGMYVRVFGYWSNGNFEANRIVLVR